MSLRVTTLCENYAGKGGVLAEAGWSALVEYDRLKVLFDTGASISVCHNADRLGVLLTDIDAIVLSHSHPDHTGGLLEVLQKIGRDHIDVIAHPAIWDRRYNRTHGVERFMGIPHRRELLEACGAEFHLSDSPLAIGNHIMTTGQIPMVTTFEHINAPIEGGGERFVTNEGTEEPDMVLDDLSLVVRTDRGLVVIAGCSHRGIINGLLRAQQISGVQHIHGVVGGAHLEPADQEQVQLTIESLQALEVERVGLCHCTGLSAIGSLAHALGDRFFYNVAGTVVDFE